MATIVKSSVGGSGWRDLAEVTLTATNDMTYEPGTGQILILRNPTAGSISCVLDGADGGTMAFPGIPSVNVGAGYSTPVPAGAVRAIPLDTVSAYLQGAISVTGTGLVAVLLGR